MGQLSSLTILTVRRKQKGVIVGHGSRVDVYEPDKGVWSVRPTCVNLRSVWCIQIKRASLRCTMVSARTIIVSY